jgi:hypothetical protein
MAASEVDMWIASRHRGFGLTVILCVTVAGLLLLRHPPCRANTCPEAALLLHVQPYSGSCETPLTDCHQIVRSTDDSGWHEFLIFFQIMDVGPWEGQGEIYLTGLDAVLTWPEAWECWEFDPCAGDFVVGPGQLDIAWYPRVYLRHSGMSSYCVPVWVGAEAGMQCGYPTGHCGDACLAHFEAPELLLTAPSGGVAEGTVRFWATHPANPTWLCPLTVDTHAPWCSGWIEPGAGYNAVVHVAADASELEPGTHETAIELTNSDQGASRCLPVVFTVGEPTPVSPMSWGRVKSIYR